MTIDIDQLTEAQLVDLNHRVVARLRFLHEIRTHARMLDFRIGESVTFQPDGHPVLAGVIAKYNRKTVTVITLVGQQWNVSPTLLRKSEPTTQPASHSAQVIKMPLK